MNTVIAIDGPAGAGKSTLARKLAEKLGYRYLDTGAMYRAVTLYMLNNNIDITNKREIKKSLNNINIMFLPPNRENVSTILLNGKNVTEEIRKTVIDKYVSQIAKIKEVRKALIKQQKKIASKKNIIVDGRDIGTRVLPDADYKFYVTASLEERAKRRYLEKNEDNNRESLEEIKNKIKKRDKLDQNRKLSPLKKAEDAVYLDTTNLNIGQAVNKMMEEIQKG